MLFVFGYVRTPGAIREIRPVFAKLSAREGEAGKVSRLILGDP